jgi:hypothetical protein
VSRASWYRLRARAKQEALDGDLELLRKAGCEGHAQWLVEQRLIKKLEAEHAAEERKIKEGYFR